MSEEELPHLRGVALSMVFQGAVNALSPVKKVGWQIAEAVRTHIPGVGKAGADARARTLLEVVGIPPARADNYPHEFFGGMRQCAMIALALAANPELVVADAPTTMLDVMVQVQMMDLFSKIRRELAMSMVLITH